MKILTYRLLASAICLLAGTVLAQDNQSGEVKPPKETYSVVKITKLNGTAEIKVLNKAELAETQKKLKYESSVIGQAFRLVAADWSKAGVVDGKKGPPFPITGTPVARTLRVVSQFSDNDKATEAQVKESKKNDEAQAKHEKLANEKKSKLKPEKKAKLEEKEQEIQSAYDKLQSKVEELAWAKETEASKPAGGEAPKKE